MIDSNKIGVDSVLSGGIQNHTQIGAQKQGGVEARS